MPVPDSSLYAKLAKLTNATEQTFQDLPSGLKIGHNKHFLTILTSFIQNTDKLTWLPN